ncbi:MAG: HNH endonuclease signature motif containing protein [Phototrophicaceae bacterium]
MQYSDFLTHDNLKQLLRSLNSRAKAQQATGRLTIHTLRDAIYSSGGQCAYCTVSVLNADFECDHIIPLRRGGGNLASNIAIACPACNRRKSDKHPARFAQETIARTGILTPLLERILKHYEADSAIQRRLFEDSDTHNAITHDSDDDTHPDEPPPYIWGKS